ncbi:Uncharacterized protein dnm_046530 [Desulfonema magnum]|uniref:Uncharacterized protein n=1 Tax=Desulfonema magnum TaxID=45655 RepID=A0A975BN59_9BACT|nr:Uncharacterized protein dnm_046530 [Desulfonema magnum]
MRSDTTGKSDKKRIESLSYESRFLYEIPVAKVSFIISYAGTEKLDH